MKVYLVERINGIGYDEARGMVIVAKNEKQAREIASKARWGDYSYNEKDITVELVDTKGEPGIILVDFLNG